MRRLYRNLAIVISCAALLSSCSAPKKVPYLVNAENIPAEVLANSQNLTDPVFMAGDLLNIQVTGIDMTTIAPFNKGNYIDQDGKINKITTGGSNTYNNHLELSTEYYLVNADGTIDFPIVGKIAVAGMKKNEVKEAILNAIYPKYLTEKPAVDIRLMNFRVVVAGAVSHPGVYQSKNERMTFLEAISMAGDLSIRGSRDNILLYRTNADGTREVHRVNIHDSEFLLSPYYNLQQNDFIYVEPNSSMRNSAWQMNPAVSATISIIGGMSSLASLVIGVVNLSK
ncbi:MAG: polysaccharide biosynthesis/export family protein [Muribaculaceae bacterium]|nr:polysaccharide biosynthesis/export family protein [Muribaculaceae bacterium]